MPGSIYRVQHYPAFRPEPAGEVHGELYRLRDPETTLEALDEYEGAEFERVIVNGSVDLSIQGGTAGGFADRLRGFLRVNEIFEPFAA